MVVLFSELFLVSLLLLLVLVIFETSEAGVGVGVDVDAVNVQGASALNATCQAGHLESLEILLEYGASINFKDREGATPLYQACAFGKGPVVERLLVTEGIDIDCQNHGTGATSLHIACQNGY